MRKTQKNRTKTRGRWGYHLIVDARDCDPTAIRSKETIRAFVKELVKAIDMVAFGPPQIVMFGTGNKKGYTLVQLIWTSFPARILRPRMLWPYSVSISGLRQSRPGF